MKYFIVPLLLIVKLSAAQTQFVPGYIILKNQTDTIRGQIDDRDWEVNPNKVTFSRNEESKVYAIKELSAFGIYNKDQYLVRKVEIDETPIKLNELLKTPGLRNKPDTTLALRILLKADLSLLFLMDQSFKVHYFYSNFGEIKELIDHHYLREKEGKLFEINNKIYQNQLKLLFADCDKKINTGNIKLDHNSLINTFIQYNDCKGCASTCYVKSNQSKPKFKVGLTIGNYMSKRSISDYNFSNTNTLKTVEFISSPIVGFSAHLYSGRNKGNNIFTIELVNQFNRIRNINSKYTIDWNAVYLSGIFRKRFFADSKIKPTIGPGISFRAGFNDRILPGGEIESFANFDDPSIIYLIDTGFEFKKLIFSLRANFVFKNYADVFLGYKIGYEYQVTNKEAKLKPQILLTYKF